MDHTTKQRKKHKAQTGEKIHTATIYDEVAGRVSETLREMRPAQPFTRDGDKTDYMKLREPYILESEFKILPRKPGLSRTARDQKRKRLEFEIDNDEDDNSPQDSLDDENDKSEEEEGCSIKEEEDSSGEKNEAHVDDEELMEIDVEDFNEQKRERNASQHYLDWLSNLPKDLSLPDSDLLKAIHTYSSDFYAALGEAQAHGFKTGASRHIAEADFRSMDPTAMIAMGVLVEELIAKELGDDGDLALLEPFGEEQGAEVPGASRTRWNGSEFVPRVLKRYASTKIREKAKGPRERKSSKELGLAIPSHSIQEIENSLPKKCSELDPYETEVDEKDQPLIR